MLATITALERALTDENLYHGHLEKFDSRKEGAFLAVPFWVAHYWMIRGDYDWVRAILEAGLKYAN
jgi:hypothetical protein